MGQMAELGYNVLYIDTDVFFGENPYPRLHDPVLKAHNIVIQRETESVHGLNIGFIWLNNCSPGGPCRWIFKEALDRLYALLDLDDIESIWKESDAAGASKEPHNRIFGVKAVLWDQHIVNDVVETLVTNKLSHRRSYLRGVSGDENKFTDFLGLPRGGLPVFWNTTMDADLTPYECSRSTCSTDAVHFRELFNFHSDGRKSNETIAGAPLRLLGGWDGIHGPPPVKGVNGWWAAPEARPSVMHFVGASGDKKPPAMLHGMWRVEAECNSTALLEDDCAFIRRKFISFDGRVLDDVVGVQDLAVKYRRVINRLLHVASVSGRIPILPMISCTNAQEITKGITHTSHGLNHWYYAWHKINQSRVFMRACNSSELYSPETVRVGAGFDTSDGRTLPSDYYGEVYPPKVRGMYADGLFEREDEEGSDGLCCVPWVSRVVKMALTDAGPGGCSGVVAYDWELEVIQEGYDIINAAKGGDSERITYERVALTKDHFADREALVGAIGEQVDAQVLVVSNVESLFWNEFRQYSDPTDLLRMRTADCRVGEGWRGLVDTNDFILIAVLAVVALLVVFLVIFRG